MYALSQPWHWLISCYQRLKHMRGEPRTSGSGYGICSTSRLGTTDVHFGLEAAGDSGGAGARIQRVGIYGPDSSLVPHLTS